MSELLNWIPSEGHSYDEYLWNEFWSSPVTYIMLALIITAIIVLILSYIYRDKERT